MEFVQKWNGKLPQTVASGVSALFNMCSFINSNSLKDNKNGMQEIIFIFFRNIIL